MSSEDKVIPSGSNTSENVSSKTIEQLMKLLSMGEELTPTQQKQMKDYKFWKTQPVPSLDEKIDAEGEIDATKTPDQIPDSPLPLLGS